MQLIDKTSGFLGKPAKRLMANAGNTIFRQLKKDFALKGKRIVVVCGSGNNGGDGLEAVRLLLEKGNSAKAVLVNGKPKTKAADEVYRKLVKKFPGSVGGKFSDIEEADLIIDAVFGTGFSGSIKGKYKETITKMNKAKGKKVSIDIPSGFDCSRKDNKFFVKADVVYYLHAIKKGSERFSKKKILGIGIPKEAENIVLPSQIKFGKRKPTSHKRDNGVITIVAGSSTYPGAAMLTANAARAAFRTGTDLVIAACPKKVAWLLNLKQPEIISRKLKGNYLSKEHEKEILELMNKSDCAVIGPGITRNKRTTETVRELVKKSKGKIVLDADAIRAVKGMKFNDKVLLTPHATEFENCFGRKLPNNYSKKLKLVKETARKHNCVILLKGALDIISDGKKAVFNATGNSGMTSGGTGDVLAGLCGAFAAENTLYDAACYAAFVNGYAGDNLFKEKAYGLIASDLIDELPVVIRKLTKGIK